MKYIYNERETKFIFKVRGEEFNLSHCELRVKNIVENSILFDLIITEIPYEMKFSIFENNSGRVSSFADYKFENTQGHTINVQYTSTKVVTICESIFVIYSNHLVC